MIVALINKFRALSKWRRGKFIINENEFSFLIDTSFRPKRTVSGFQFTEGPVWDIKNNWLLFSDIPGNTIYVLSKDRRVSVFRHPSNKSNGLTYDQQQRLITCEHETRQITRTEHNDTLTILCNDFNGKLLNSPNDIIVKSDGSIYFTDPIFGIKPEDQEQPVQGVYRYTPADNSIRLVSDNIKMPNGLVFSPDEKYLYVNSSHKTEKKIFRYNVNNDGNIINKQEFYDLESMMDGVPDGMKVDINGNLYCAGPGGIWVFNSAGKHLGTIVLPELPSNCAWGDADLRTLYITARSSVYTVRAKIGGWPLSGVINNM